MRIASISKSLTTAAVARLCEEGKLDLDVPVQQYVPEFPAKQFDGEDVSFLMSPSLSAVSQSLTLPSSFCVVLILPGHHNPADDSVSPQWDTPL